MIALRIRIAVDTASPALARVREALSNENLLPFFAEIVAQEMQANFMSLDGSRINVLGGERQHYFAQAADRVTWEASGDDRVIVYSDQPGIRMKYFGGSISPVHATYLTIPVSAEAYGKRAGDFPDLKVFYGKNGPYALGRIIRGTLATMGARSGSAVATQREILFILTQQAVIQPDESILPSRTRLNAALHIGFNDYIQLAWENAGGGNN